MNPLYKVLEAIRLERDALYIGEIVAIMPFYRWQVEEILITLVLMGAVKEQTGFKQMRYFYNE